MMSGTLDGRAALITGATAGLGLEIGKALAQSGCKVMLHGIEPAESMVETCAALQRSSGQDIRYIQANLATPAGVGAMIAATQDAFGAIDILVNNAVVRHFAALDTFPLDRWQQALAVNLTAPLHAIQLVLPGMRARGWGRIVNMASVYGQRGTPGRVDYVTTKAAILGLTRAVAAEVADEAITCNAVCPGSVSTPGTETRVEAIAANGGMSRADAVKQFLAGKQPSGRFVEAGNVAAMIAFLCGPAGDDINGAIMPVDGGWLAT